jgi:hypothetical protein
MLGDRDHPLIFGDVSIEASRESGKRNNLHKVLHKVGNMLSRFCESRRSISAWLFFDFLYISVRSGLSLARQFPT